MNKLTLNLLSDQGTNFEAALFQSICRILGILKQRTTAYRPSANGQVERVNSTLMACVRCYVEKCPDEWDRFVPLIAAAMRSAKQQDTGCTPNLLMLGREINTPSNCFVPDPEGELGQPVDSYPQKLQCQLQLAHQVARDKLRVVLKRAKDRADGGRKIILHEVGEPVYFLNQAPADKLQPKWWGPGVVTHVIGPDIYRILLHNRDSKVVHHDSLKKCHLATKDLPKWLIRAAETAKQDADPVYCLCHRGDDGFFMLQCNHCLEWFHGACVGVVKGQLKREEEFLCPNCQ